MNLADVKAHLDELVDRAEAGESIEITREGRPVARLVPIENPPRPAKALKKIDIDALTARQSPQKSDIVREMRDFDRY